MTANRALPVVALVLAALLAGCTGGKTGTSTGVGAGHLDQQFVDAGSSAASTGTAGSPGTGAPPKPGLGTIEGTIVDDGNLTLPGAGVSLLGTQLYATSGKHGEFRFADLKPDVYGLRVQAPAFQVYEGKVTVQSGKVSKVTVTMVPNDSRGPGYRPHVHDYWGRDTQVTLMDDDVDLRQPTSESAGSNPTEFSALVTTEYPNENHTMYFHLPTEERNDGRPPLVLPYTKELQVTVTWDPADVQVKQFGIGYTPASASRTTYFNLHPHASGDPWAIPLQPKDTDNGHQYFTLWKFSIWTANAYGQTASFTPETIQGPIRIKVVLVKGDVSVDPPHADNWNGTTSFVARSGATEFNYLTVCCTASNINAALDKGRLVPPGTNKMHIKLTWTTKNGANEVPPSPADGDWVVSWKPASMDPNQYGPPDYKTAAAASSGTRVKEWEVPVASTDTDAFYQTSSNWLFRIYQPSNQGLPWSAGDYSHYFRLEVTVYKDPNFT